MCTMQHTSFKCFYLGMTRYRNIFKLQEKLTCWHQQVDSESPTLLLLQHQPVYTVGLRTKSYTEEDVARLQLLGADFVKTNRGGLITFHGPGQLVVYPIFNLRKAKLGIGKYVYQLEEVIIQLCTRFGLEGSRSPHTGVWIGNNKICAMGISCQRQVTSHGLALNCSTNMDWFSKIVPCGIHGKGVTSISESIGTEVKVKETVPIFMENFSEVFNWKATPVVTLNGYSHYAKLYELITGEEMNKLTKRTVSQS